MGFKCPRAVIFSRFIVKINDDSLGICQPLFFLKYEVYILEIKYKTFLEKDQSLA